jgi:tRNA(fMet)-specific endonuclease VapC
MILLDTSILIEYYRKKDKKDTLLFKLSETHSFSISVVTKYELLAGTKPDKLSFTLSIIQNMKVLELNEKCIDIAIEIFNELKSKNQIIEVPDIFIAATAIHNKLPIATLNTNHFDRIPNTYVIQN